MNEDKSVDVDFAVRLEQLHDRLRREGIIVPEDLQVDDDLEVQQALDALLLIQQVKKDQTDNSAVVQAAQETQRPQDTPVEPLVGSGRRLDLENQHIGRFEVVELIGKGGYGNVYRARDLDVGRDVALKIPRLQIIASPELETRFIREAKAAGALSHPNIVTVYETGRDQEVFYIASELVEGNTLAQWLTESDALPSAKQVAQLISTLADAMQHAHSRGVLHRDLKPSNILLEKSKTPAETQDDLDANALSKPRIADFGLAKIEQDETEATQTGMIVGTPAYMAPEQTDGTRGVGAAADIYSLGAVMYELVTGRKPFVGTTILEMIKAVKEEQPIAPQKLRADVPRDLEAICLKCLEKEPHSRYATAGELEADLQRFLNGQTVIARPITNTDRVVRWTRRNPMIAGSLGAAVFFLVTALVATTVGWISTNDLLAREGVAKADAQQRYQDMKNAIDTYFINVEANPVLKNTPGTEPLRNELLELALDYYEQYVAENRNDPELKSDIGETEFRIAEILRELSSFKEARLHYELAAELVDEQLNTDPDDADLRKLKAQISHGLASVSLSIGNLDDASKFCRQAIELQQALHDENPDDFEQLQRLARYNGQLGGVLRNNGKLDEWVEQMMMAQSMFEMALTLDESDRDFRLSAIKNKGGLAKAFRATGNMKQAEALTTEVASELRAIVETEPNFWAAHEVYTVSIISKSTFAFMRGDFDAPLQELEHALSTIDRLCWLHSDMEKYVNKKQGVLTRLAIVAQRSGDNQKAELIFQELVDIARDQLARDESIIDSKFNLSQHLANLVTIRLASRQLLDRSKQIVEEASQLAEACCAAQPDNYEYRLLQIMIQKAAADLAYQCRDLDGSLKYSDHAVELIQAVKESGAADPRINHHAYIVYQNRARANQELGNFEDSLRDWLVTIELSPPHAQVSGQLRLAAAHLRLGQFKDSEAIFATIDLAQLRKSDYFLLARCYSLAASIENDKLRLSQFVDKALDALDEARKQRYFNSPVKIEKLTETMDLETIRKDDRFSVLLDLVKKDAEQTD